MPRIKISMSTELYKEIKKLSEGRYLSVPEFLRDALRQHLYRNKPLSLTKGFIREFEKEISKSRSTSV